MKQKLSTRVLSMLMVVVMAFVMLSTSIFSVLAQKTNDESTEEIMERLNPSCTLIYSAEDFNRIRENVSGTYILMNDIDLSEYENWKPIGSSDNPFTGDLLGAGYTISGMNITTLPETANDDWAYVGLFGYNKGIIRDLSLYGTVSTELTENQKAYIGSFVGYNDGKILNCRDRVIYHDYAESDSTLYTGAYKLTASSTTNITLGNANVGGYRGDGGDGGKKTIFASGGKTGEPGTNRTETYSSYGASGNSPVLWKTQCIDTIHGVQTIKDFADNSSTVEIPIVTPDATIKVYDYVTQNAQVTWNNKEDSLKPIWTSFEVENKICIKEGNATYYGNEINPYAILIAVDPNALSCTIHKETEYIYSYAFSGCSKLSAITIPAKTYGIGQYAFSGCSSLTRFISSHPIDDIGNHAFLNCSNLKEVLLVDHPDIMRIGEAAFQNCSSLVTLDLPKGINHIAPNTFDGAKKLKQIDIPTEVTIIGAKAFIGCTQLQSVTFEENSQLTEIGSSAFADCSTLQSIILPTNLCKIHDSAFKQNISMTSLHIPATVDSIGANAFLGCSAIKSITVDEANSSYKAKANTLIKKDNNQAILGCENSNIRAAGVTSVASGAFVNIHFTTQFDIPEECFLENGAFNNCSGEIMYLTQKDGSDKGFIDYSNLVFYSYNNYWNKGGNSLKDPKVYIIKHHGECGDGTRFVLIDMQKIHQDSFTKGLLFVYGNGTLEGFPTTIKAENGVEQTYKSYNEYAAACQIAITEAHVCDGITSIGSEAFANFSALGSLRFGKDVQSINKNAVYGCTYLSSIFFEGDCPAVHPNAFSGESANYSNLKISYDINTSGWNYNGFAYQSFVLGSGFSTDPYVMGEGYPVVTDIALTPVDYTMTDRYGIKYEFVSLGTDESSLDDKNLHQYVIVKAFNSNASTEKEITIPLKILYGDREFAVLEIDSNAFRDVTNIENIKITTSANSKYDNPLGINKISGDAFAGCTAQVYLVGDSIFVDESAFDEGAGVIINYNSTGWKEIIQNVTIYETNALIGYQDQNGIYYTINLDNNTAIVGKMSNQSEENLVNTSGATAKDIVIPDFVTYNDRLYKVVGFDRYAFFGNSTAETIKFGVFIGEGQTEEAPAIWDCTFRNIDNLTDIITEHNPYYMTETGVLYGSPLVPEGEDIAFTRLVKYPNKKSDSEFIIHENVTVIENYAFAGNSKLKIVWLASKAEMVDFSVSVIGSHAFWNCTSLIELRGNYQIHDVGDSAFENTSIKMFKFGESLSTIGVRAFYGSKLEGRLEINDNVTYIGESAFSRCYEIKEFIFCDYSNSLEKVLKSQTVNGIYKVDFANADESGYAAIFECRNGINTLLQFAASFELTDVDMTDPKRIVPHAIATEVFRGAKFVERIIMNDATAEVGSEAFADCRRLEYVKLGTSYFGSNTNDTIGGIYSYNLFINCPVLEYIEVAQENEHFINDSNGVLYSKDKTVLYCYPAGIQRVNYKVPATVTKLYDFAFYGNSALKQVIVGTTEQLSIGSRAFGNCINLTSVYYITEYVPIAGEKIYDNTPKSLHTRFKAEFADAGWSQYASADNEMVKVWCERSVDEFEIISEVPNDVVKTNDYLIFVKNSSVEALSDVYIIVTVYVFEKNNDDNSEVIVPHKFYLKTDDNGSINFSIAEIEGKKVTIAPYIHIYAQKEGYYTYDQDLYLDTDMLISFITMTMDPDVFGVSCEEVDINSQTADLNLALYREHVSYTVQNGNNSSTVERIDYRDVTIKVLGFWDVACTNPEFTLIQSGKILPTQTFIDGNNCTFVISAEAFFDANGIVNEDSIEVRVTVQNGDKGMLECRKVLNINVFDFEINDEDINLDFEADISLEEGPDIFKQLFGSAGFQIKLGENAGFKTMIKGSQVVLTLTAGTPDPEKYPKDGYKNYEQPHNKGSFFYQYYDGLLTYNIRFVKSNKDHYFYYRLYVYFGAPGVKYNDSLMEEKALYGAINLSPYEAQLKGREKVRLRSFSIFMETRKWIIDTFISKDGCFNLDRFGKDGLKGFEPPCDEYASMNQNGNTQVKNTHSFKAEIEGELVFEYAKGEGLHLASGSIKGCLKYTFKHYSQYIVWVIPVTLEVEVSVSGEIFLKLRFDDPETSVSLQELSAKLTAEIQASVGVGCSIASVGIYGNIGTVIIFDILPDPSIREWEIHGEFGAYVKIFWYKQKFSIWSGKYDIIGNQDNEIATEKILSSQARMYLASSYRYSADCDEKAQIVKIQNKYYKFYFTPVTKSGYDEYNCVKLVYSVWTFDGWSDYTIVEDNGKADAAYTILDDESGVYLAFTQQTKKLTADSVNDTTIGAEGLSLKWIDLSFGVENIEVKKLVDGKIDGNYKYALQIGISNGSPVLVWAENSENNIFGVSSKNYYDESTQTSHIYQTTANSIWIAEYIPSKNQWDINQLEDGISAVIDMAVGGDAVYYIVDLDGDLTDSSDCTLKKMSIDSGITVNVAAATAVENHNGQIFYYGIGETVEGLHIVSGNAMLPEHTTMLNNGYVALTDKDGISALLYLETKSWQELGETLSCSVIKGMFREGDVWGDPVLVYDPMLADCYIASFDAEMIAGQMNLTLQICDGSGSTVASKSVNYDLEKICFDYNYDIDYLNQNVICHLTNLGARSATFCVSEIKCDILSGKSYVFVVPFGNSTTLSINIKAENKQSQEEENFDVKIGYVDLKPYVKQMVVGEQNSILIAIRNNGNIAANNVTLYVLGGVVSNTDFSANVGNTDTLKKQLKEIKTVSLDRSLIANGILYYELILDDSIITHENGIISFYVVEGELMMEDGCVVSSILEPKDCLADNTTAINLSEISQTVDGNKKDAEEISPKASINTEEFFKFSDGSIADNVEITIIANPSDTLTVTLSKNDKILGEFKEENSVSYIRNITVPAKQLNALEEGDYNLNVLLNGIKLKSFDLTICMAENIPNYITVKWYDEDGKTLLHTELIKEGDCCQNPPAPIKTGNIFSHWNEQTHTENSVSYIAVYKKDTPTIFKVTWIVANGLEIVRSVEQGEIPSIPQRTYLGEVIRGWDCNYDGMADELVAVSRDITYVALFDQSMFDFELYGSVGLGMIIEVNLTKLPFFSDSERISKLKYQWYLDGEAIKGASTSSYELSAHEYGKAIWVLAWDADWIGSSRSFVVADHPHAVYHNAYQAPTCEHNGTIEYWYCYSCNAVFLDVECTKHIKLEDTVILATKHQYQFIVTPPTCLTEGYTTHTCQNCQHTYVDSKVEKGDHSMSEWTEIQVSTCVADGIEKRYCTNCDYFEIQTIAKHPHVFNGGKITVQATAASIGIKTFVCENCDYSYHEELPKDAPQIIEQSKDVWKEWYGDETIAFRSNASYEDFIEVRINGEVLSDEYYTLREGSIIIELKFEYLNSLQNGDYKLEIVSQGGIASTNFSVSKKVIENPWLVYSVIILLIFGIWFVFFKKKSLVLRSKV